MTWASRHAIVVTGSGSRRRVGEVDAAVGVDRPAVGHRLPEVLVVGEAVEPRSQLHAPVQVELFGQLAGGGRRCS